MKAIKRNTKVVVSVLLIVIFSGCTSLDEKVYSTLTPEVYYNNADDALTALMGVYNVFNRQHFYTNDLFVMVFLPNKYTVTRVPARKQFASFSFSSTDSQVASVWKFSYNAINRANAVISRVPYVDMDESLKAEFVGEAKFLRALSYFNLVRLFGGVPLKTAETVSLEHAFTGRSSIQEVYDLIVQDLKDAQQSLPATRPLSEKGRATECAAMALLGKVYLTMAGHPLKQNDKWEMARTQLKSVIDRKSEFGVDLLSSFADVFDVNKEESNIEAIFAIQFSHEADQGSALAFFASPLASPFATANGQYNYGFTTDFRDLYEDGDNRKNITLVSSFTAFNGAYVEYGVGSWYKDPNGIALGKYQDGPPGTAASNVRHANDIILLRYADVLLMYAEAENEVNGANASVFGAINEVRARANAALLSGSESQEEIRNLVYIERMKELSGELNAFFDIQRLERLEDHVNNSYEAQIANVTYDSKMYLYPIPQDEMDVNTGINLEDQNPGY